VADVWLYQQRPDKLMCTLISCTSPFVINNSSLQEQEANMANRGYDVVVDVDAEVKIDFMLIPLRTLGLMLL
jgi:hypothetical protein